MWPYQMVVFAGLNYGRDFGLNFGITLTGIVGLNPKEYEILVIFFVGHEDIFSLEWLRIFWFGFADF